MSTAEMARHAKRPLPSDIQSLMRKVVKLKVMPRKPDVLQEWQKFEDSAPCLTGQDVRDLGYKPGPLFTKMFDAIRQARWEGKLRTREEEIRFLQNTFPLNHAH